MKNFKKMGLVFLLVVMITTLTACGSGNSDKNSGGSSKSLKTSDLSIEDFKWETVSSKCNGYDCYVLSLTNNSKFDIIGVDFTYKVKNDATDEQLKIYDAFMKDHEGYIEEDDSPKDVTLKGSKNSLVQKGDELTGLRFTVGFKNWSWYDYPTDEQFKLMEPKELSVGIVGDDNKLYIAYYNFQNKSWKLDEKTADVDTWSKKEIAKKVSKPNEKHHIVRTDEEDEFELYSYGMSRDMYNEYVEILKSSGFTNDSSSSSRFDGKDSSGHTVVLDYEEDESTLYIRINKE